MDRKKNDYLLLFINVYNAVLRGLQKSFMGLIKLCTRALTVQKKANENTKIASNNIDSSGIQRQHNNNDKTKNKHFPLFLFRIYKQFYLLKKMTYCFDLN